MEEFIKTDINNNNKLLSRIDELGRIEIKLEKRKQLGIVTGDKFEIYIENTSIVLRKLDISIEKEQLVQMTGKIERDVEIKVQIYRLNNTISSINDIGHNIRVIDEFGKIAIPVILRNKLNIVNNDIVEIDISGNNLILTKKEKNRKDGRKCNSYHNRRKRQNCHQY